MNNTVLNINNQTESPTFLEMLLCKMHPEKPLFASFYYDEEDLFSRRLDFEDRDFDHLSDK